MTKIKYTKRDGTEAKRKAPGKRTRKNLTEDIARHLPCRRAQYMVWDTGMKGLHVMVSPGGARTYRSLWYYPGSAKPYTRKLGRVGVIALDKARELCLADQKAAREGSDPKRDEPTHSGSFVAVVNEYINREQIGRKQNATAEEARRILLKDCATFKHRPIATIRFGEIDRLLEHIRDGDAEHPARPYLAVKLWGHLGALFTWCVKKQKLDRSPMAAVDKPWDKAEPRERVFSDDELKKLWTCDTRTVAAANGDKVKLSPTEAAYLKLLILTGKRKSALAAMRWSGINAAWVWTPPPGNKNKRVHPIPLPKLAQRILLGLKPQDAKPDDLVFGALNWRFQTRVQRLSGIEDFFPHAIRHTVETELAKLRTVLPNGETIAAVPPHLRDLLLDHAPNRGSGKDYEHYDYETEKRVAMELWADHVERLVVPEGTRALR
jgi:integrase